VEIYLELISKWATKFQKYW